MGTAPLRLGPPVVLLLLVLAVYGGVGELESARYDDFKNIVENPRVLGGLTPENLAWAFDLEKSPVSGIWHPLTWISLMIDAELYGDWPGGFHLTNAILHLGCVLVLYGWLLSTTGARWKSLFVAAVFAVHPLHVESVAWVSERKNILSTLLGLVALWTYCRFARSGARGWYLAALSAFGLSLLSKPMLVTLPFVMLLLDFWPLERTPGGDRVALVPGDAGPGPGHRPGRRPADGRPLPLRPPDRPDDRRRAIGTISCIVARTACGVGVR